MSTETNRFTRRTRRALVAAGAAMALVAAACGGEGDGEASSGPDCAPAGTELAAGADTTVDVSLDDYAIGLSTSTVDAGVVTFDTTNEGSEPHELAFLPGGGDVPFTADAPDEEALAGRGAFELEAYGPGRSCSATYDLEPGTYTLFCIVDSPDGQTHLEKGMRATLTVR